jgi:hypothetical protein
MTMLEKVFASREADVLFPTIICGGMGSAFGGIAIGLLVGILVLLLALWATQPLIPKRK